MAQEPLGLRCPRFSLGCARTHSGILTSCHSRPTFPRALHCYRNAPLPLCRKTEGQASAGRFIPTNFGAFTLDQCAITHSLKGLLLLIQPSCLHGTNHTFVILSGHFRALACALGSFPSGAGHY